MAALSEAALEPCLKRLFMRRSVWVQDNWGVKNYQTLTFGRLVAEAPSASCSWLVRWTARWAMRWAVTWIGGGLLVVSSLVWHGGALASDKGDHERALQAVQSGQVLPLAKVLALVEREHPGQVLEVELESEGPSWLYEIKLLQPDGRLSKLKVDARTGEILKRKIR